MPDDADLANDVIEGELQRALASRRVAERRADFCDCDAWKSGQFCGDRSCRDAYEREQRLLQRR